MKQHCYDNILLLFNLILCLYKKYNLLGIIFIRYLVNINIKLIHLTTSAPPALIEYIPHRIFNTNITMQQLTALAAQQASHESRENYINTPCVTDIKLKLKH